MCLTVAVRGGRNAAGMEGICKRSLQTGPLNGIVRATMKIIMNGLHAGIQHLNERCDGFDIGTGDEYHIPFMCELLRTVVRASGIIVDIDEDTQHTQTTHFCEDRRDTLPSAPWVACLAAEHLESEAGRHLTEEANGSIHFACCLPFQQR